MKLIGLIPFSMERILQSDTISVTVSRVKVELVYHDSQADTGGSNYGTEFAIKLTRRFLQHYPVLISYPTYNADELKTDTQNFSI